MYSVLPSSSNPLGPSGSRLGTDRPDGSPSSRTLRVPLGLITETIPEFGVAPVSAARRLPPGPVIIFEGFDKPLAKRVAVCCAVPEPAARPNNMPNVSKLLSVRYISAHYIMKAHHRRKGPLFLPVLLLA